MIRSKVRRKEEAETGKIRHKEKAKEGRRDESREEAKWKKQARIKAEREAGRSVQTNENLAT